MNKLNAWALFVLAALPGQALAASRPIRAVVATDSAVIPVRCSLGYSTILDFPSRPLTAVLGDQDAFKLEYIGHALTLKPLLPKARSNLFVFTDGARYNFLIETGQKARPDLVVKVTFEEKSYPVRVEGAPSERPQDAALQVTKIGRSAAASGIKLTVLSLEQDRARARQNDPRAITIVNFEIQSLSHPTTLEPSTIGIKQRGRIVQAESLFLDSLKVTPQGSPVRGKIALFSTDFDPLRPITLSLILPNAKKSRHPSEICVSTAKASKSAPQGELWRKYPWDSSQIGPAQQNALSTSIFSRPETPIPNAAPSGLIPPWPLPASP